MHPEIDNPEYQADDSLYKYDDIGVIGFDLWQVRLCRMYTEPLGSPFKVAVALF